MKKYEYSKPLEVFLVCNGEVRMFAQRDGFSLRAKFTIRKIEYTYDISCKPNLENPLNFSEKEIRRVDNNPNISSMAYGLMEDVMRELRLTIIADRQDLINASRAVWLRKEIESNLEKIEELKNQNISYETQINKLGMSDLV